MKVSIIIPAFNAAEFISNALNSALSQTYRNIEVIVVDDGSNDATTDIVKSFGDDRILLFRHESSLGPSAARNTAIQHSTGSWIALLDADDEFQEDRLESMISAATARGLDAIADNLQMVDFDTRDKLGLAFDRFWPQNSGALTVELMISKDWPGKFDGKAIGYMKPVFTKRLIEKFDIKYDEDLWIGEDFLFYMKMAIHGAKFGFVDTASYIYSIRKSSVSKKPKTYELVKAHDRIEAFFLRHGAAVTNKKFILNLLKKRRSALLWDVFYGAIKARELMRAASVFAEVDKCDFVQISVQRLRRSLFG